MDTANGDVLELMRDVNHFLTTTLHNESLSSNALEEKEELLKKMSCFSEILTPYLDMSRSSKSSKIIAEYVPLNVSEDRVDSQLYEEFPDQTLCYSLPPEESQSGSIIEYLILPVSKLRGVAKKFGALWRKEKFMGLFGERTIRCWVGILGDVLYIYGSDRDPKPDSFVNLTGFEARPAVSQYPKDVKKRHCCFELVCPGKKSLQFLASSVPDMEQWISCINEVSSPTNNDNEMKKRQLPSPPPSTNGSQEYDDIRALKRDVRARNEANGEKIYHNLKNLGVKDDSCAVANPRSVSSTKAAVHELLYDDICSVRSSLYSNVADPRTEQNPECDGPSPAFASSDEEDIYDDIGLLSSAADAAVFTNFVNSDSSSASKKADNTSPKHSVRENMCAALDKSLLCADNLYEPVDNP